MQWAADHGSGDRLFTSNLAHEVSTDPESVPLQLIKERHHRGDPSSISRRPEDADCAGQGQALTAGDLSGTPLVQQEQVRSHFVHEDDRLRLAPIQVGSECRHGSWISDWPDSKPVGGEGCAERSKPEDVWAGPQHLVLNAQRDKHLVEEGREQIQAANSGQVNERSGVGNRSHEARDRPSAAAIPRRSWS